MSLLIGFYTANGGETSGGEELKSCAITSHRPARFKWGYKENYAGCKRLKKRLRDQFMGLYEQGVHCFYVGGALGVDMWAGEILFRLKEQPEYGDLELHIVLPGKGHDTNWDDRSKARMAFLRKHSTSTVTVGNGLTPQDYRACNQYMVDHADVLVAVYDNDRSIRSGTGMTVNYAKKRKVPIIMIHPDTAIVTKL